MTERELERERRLELARGFEESGETRAEYARRMGWKAATLDYYRRRARVASAPVQWVEVEPQGQRRTGAAELVLVLGEGLRVEVGAGFEAAALRRLLEVLERGR